MGTIEIVGSARRGLASCDFDVRIRSGGVAPREIFNIEDRGSAWEFIIVSAAELTSDITRLCCISWIPNDGAFAGKVATTRKMSVAERKRWGKLMPPA